MSLTTLQYRQFRQLWVDHLQPEVSAAEAQAFFYLWLEHHHGWSKTQYSLQAEQPVSPTLWAQWMADAPRLKKCEPIQYVLGEAWFMGQSFAVAPGVLIPRPETEELVHWMLETATLSPTGQGVDIGCGSGCIGLSMAHQKPNWQWTLWDISPTALELSQRNQARLGAQVEIAYQDALALPKVQAAFDLIVSNPPYIRPSEKAEMQANVLDYEPELALFVPENDPLLFYRAIAQWAQSALQPQGNLFFEINQYLGPDMLQLLESLDFEAELRADVYGNMRMVRAQLRR